MGKAVKKKSRPAGRTQPSPGCLPISPRSVDVSVIGTVECCICGETFEHDCYSHDGAANATAVAASKEGWRDVESSKFECIGPMCPDCAATPDRDRGD